MLICVGNENSAKIVGFWLICVRSTWQNKRNDFYINELACPKKAKSIT